MSQQNICSICGKRRAQRLCPAIGEKICAVCCGTEREVKLDCPADCSYLLSAHRYEQEHRAPLAPEAVAFPQVEFSPTVIYKHEQLMSRIGFAILEFMTQRRELTDSDTFTALIALGETYRTLASGIYYEKPPGEHVANELYVALAAFLQKYKSQEAERAQSVRVADLEIFYLLVFLARTVQTRTNGRTRARIFLDFLRTQYPPAQVQPEPSRIIVP